MIWGIRKKSNPCGVNFFPVPLKLAASRGRFKSITPKLRAPRSMSGSIALKVRAGRSEFKTIVPELAAAGAGFGMIAPKLPARRGNFFPIAPGLRAGRSRFKSIARRGPAGRNEGVRNPESRSLNLHWTATLHPPENLGNGRPRGLVEDDPQNNRKQRDYSDQFDRQRNTSNEEQSHAQCWQRKTHRDE
jgi:hypothetical protein